VSEWDAPLSKGGVGAHGRYRPAGAPIAADMTIVEPDGDQWPGFADRERSRGHHVERVAGRCQGWGSPSA